MLEAGGMIVKNGDIKELFRSRGIKNTNQRRWVYSCLIEKKQPITAEDIYMELIKKESTKLNLSTVYRVLETFAKKNIVQKSRINIEGKATFEINHMDHRHHLVCMKCNMILPIKGCPLEDYENSLASSTGFEIMEHHLEIKGICPDCQRKPNKI